MKQDKSLRFFHPLIQRWFLEQVGEPTEIQIKAWPIIASNKHVLITAPTGSGKTLAAFLWSLNQLITGKWPSGRPRVLYISPLRALNNDIQKNLIKPLLEIKDFFSMEGKSFPLINTATRSGDTPPEERQRMLRRPPEILITTPESLNIMLTAKRSRDLFTGIGAVIMDEIHAVAGTKRGTHLITAVDRLIPICGEFQRIALSATVRPAEKIAQFIGGYRASGVPPHCSYKNREVEIIESTETKNYNIRICLSHDAEESLADDDAWWTAFAGRMRSIVNENNSTLFFTNSRRTAEKLARLINEGGTGTSVYAHHGSLSREIRMVVEDKLKKGELKAVVATNSLELGIDIGTLDLVVLVQSPFSVSSALQRIGRSGHSVGQDSLGLFFPTSGRDFLNSAVISRCIREMDIESLEPVDCPLDVLAQVILSMTTAEKFNIDNLFALLRTSYPFYNLAKDKYMLVLQMLAGKYADSHIRELRARLYLDALDNTVKAKDSSRFLLYMSGGTIPDRGYFNLRMDDTGAKIGELDEEFVWERRTGETFALGTKTWRIKKITHNDVLVVHEKSRPGIIPFWKAEELNRGFHLSEKISTFLEYANDNMNKQSFLQELIDNYSMYTDAAYELEKFLKLQSKVTGSDLPHRHHLLIEHYDDPMNLSDNKQVILHTLWGGRVNRPFALVLAEAWQEKYSYPLEIMANNDCVALMLPHDFNSQEIFSLISQKDVEPLLRNRLEQTGFFGARFRENAGRALLLPRQNFRKRLPLWLNRLRAKKLMDAVLNYKDFPILLETWRSCFLDEFDLENLNQIINEIKTGVIKITETVTKELSPFSQDTVWRQTNKYMYQEDLPSKSRSSLNSELISQVAGSSSLRPKIPESLIKILDEKLKRTAPGYAPPSALDLLEWLKERILVPEIEWEKLLKSIKRDHNLKENLLAKQLGFKAVSLTLPGAFNSAVTAIESLPIVMNALGIYIEQVKIAPIHDDAEKEILDIIGKYLKNKNNPDTGLSLSQVIQQWISFYGPIKKQEIMGLFGLKEYHLEEILEVLVESDLIIIDHIREGSGPIEICDRENLETLLRMNRSLNQPVFEPLDLKYLQPFLAQWQGLTHKGEDMKSLQSALEMLFGYPAAPGSWETFILPSRIEGYHSSWIDRLLSNTGLIWFGCGREKISFTFENDLSLFDPPAEKKADDEIQTDIIPGLFPGKLGRYSFQDLMKHTEMEIIKIAEKLWEHAWNRRITNDSFESIRMGLTGNFNPSCSHFRSTFGKEYQIWMAQGPIPGNWFILNENNNDLDPIEKEELIKERVRLLLKRYGILFKELLSYELPGFAWGQIFRSLRLMELSGEILSGCFFNDIPGIQFISHEAYRSINRIKNIDAVYWLHAQDPASLCGLKIPGIKSYMPARRKSTFIVFHNENPVLVLTSNCSALEFRVKPGDHNIQEYLTIFRDLMNRDYKPVPDFFVNSINRDKATMSPYAEDLIKFGFKKSYNSLHLTRDIK